MNMILLAIDRLLLVKEMQADDKVLNVEGIQVLLPIGVNGLILAMGFGQG